MKALLKMIVLDTGVIAIEAIASLFLDGQLMVWVVILGTGVLVWITVHGVRTLASSGLQSASVGWRRFGVAGGSILAALNWAMALMEAVRVSLSQPGERGEAIVKGGVFGIAAWLISICVHRVAVQQGESGEPSR